MYGNYFPYGGFGMNSGALYRGMMPGMARMAGNGIMRNAVGTATGNAAIKGPGLLSGLFNGIRSMNWGGLLTNTQKTLGIVNQAIPVYHQVKPLYNNVRTAFRVLKAVNKDNKEGTTANSTNENTTAKEIVNTNKSTNSNIGPNFFQ